MGKRLTYALFTTLVLSFLLAACGPPVPATIARAPARSLSIRGKGEMRSMASTRMSAQLASVGLDPKKLPPLEQLDKSQRLLVMETFSAALGVPCSGCHADPDFRADTRRKRVAKRMWNDFVRGLAFDNGDVLYCDSCHNGQLFSLDRRDKDKVADFMASEFVGRLKRTDNKDHDCGTCHGDPPEFAFLGDWRESPAPDVRIVKAPALVPTAAPSNPPPATTAAPPPASTTSLAKPPPTSAVKPPASGPAAPAGPCGTKLNPCPLQKWMRANIAPAVTANDTQALARALDRLASFSPDGSWRWAEIAKTGAEFARQGDMSAARKSCKGCHELYKPSWKSNYRSRPVK
jgi:hypothetical protein